MGASSQRRRANQQAAAQYMSALRSAEPVDTPRRAATSNRRDIQDVGLEDQLDGATRRGLQRLDRIGTKVNAEDRSGTGLREAIQAYNERLGVLNRQLAGEAVTRFVLLEPDARPSSSGAVQAPSIGNPQTGLLSAGTNLGMSMSGPIVSGAQSGLTAIAQQPLPPPRNTGLSRSFGTREDALAALRQKQPSLSDAELNARISPVTGPSLGSDFVGYRNLPILEQQYNDLADLTSEINSAAQSSARNQYVDLADKLNRKVQKAASRFEPQANTGLIGSELAAELDTGVLK